ncbi:MAG: DUF881 domain-containing protein [Actinobacteria bacterium]|nr:DUF881 domain-containing protein [Actinomycetota bacterium]MTA97566.1 DUF881 domain-containing protein [Actinomycetota bacterium]
MWSIAVPIVAVGAGFLIVSGASTAQGTDLRAERRTELTDLIAARQVQLSARTDAVAGLRSDVTRLSQQGNISDAAASKKLEAQAGMSAVKGPGLTVELNDAPRSVQSALPAGVEPDDVVVHQQDVQGVVNALWSGGAQAMRIMDQRVISTSAVRCVGNTLILQGRVYSPPFRISAIGNQKAMQKALAASPEVAAYRTWVDAVGLGYREIPEKSLTLPGYTGSVKLLEARRAP